MTLLRSLRPFRARDFVTGADAVLRLFPLLAGLIVRTKVLSEMMALLKPLVSARLRPVWLAELLLASAVSPVVLRSSVDEEFHPTSFGGRVCGESGPG